MFQRFLKVFFGNILSVIGWILIIGGIIGLPFSVVMGVVIIVIGIALLSLSTVMRHKR